MRRFPSAAALMDALADNTAAILREAVAERGRASFAVPGGRTPGPFLTALAARDLPWRQITVTLTDERWVPNDHADSNERLLRGALVDRAAGIGFIPLYTGAGSPEDGQAACEQALGALPRPLDLVVLGMGEDGHVASLFPDTPGLVEAMTDASAGCRAMRPPGAAQGRMTLTLPLLLDSRRVVILVTGEGKLRTLEAAQAEGPAAAMPVRAVLRQTAVPVEVWWAP